MDAGVEVEVGPPVPVMVSALGDEFERRVSLEVAVSLDSAAPAREVQANERMEGMDDVGFGDGPRREEELEELEEGEVGDEGG